MIKLNKSQFMLEQAAGERRGREGENELNDVVLVPAKGPTRMMPSRRQISWRHLNLVVRFVIQHFGQCICYFSVFLSLTLVLFLSFLIVCPRCEQKLKLKIVKIYATFRHTHTHTHPDWATFFSIQARSILFLAFLPGLLSLSLSFFWQPKQCARRQ